MASILILTPFFLDQPSRLAIPLVPRTMHPIIAVRVNMKTEGNVSRRYITQTPRRYARMHIVTVSHDPIQSPLSLRL